MTENNARDGETKAPFIDVVFDGPPGPVAGRFVEVEDASGSSIRVGEWIERPDGNWALRLRAGELHTNAE